MIGKKVAKGIGLMLQFWFVQVGRDGERVHWKSCVVIFKRRMKAWGNNSFKM